MGIKQFNTVSKLRIAIQQLEIKQTNEWAPLKEQLLATGEILKPTKNIKDTLNEIFSESNLKTTTINTTLGLVTMLAVNFFFPTKASSQLVKPVTDATVSAGTIGQVVVNGSPTMSLGNHLLKKFISKPSDS